MHDVTVSVWNKFWSPHLTAGLTEAGYDVLSLGSARRKPPCSVSRTCWSSGLLTQASFHVPLMRDTLTRLGIERYHRFAVHHALESRCLWGWSNHHLAAFEKAHAAGIPVILETGSTHALWARSVLAAEYTRQGLKFDHSLIDQLMPRMLAEYKIADKICVPNSFVARTFEYHGIPAGKLAVNPYGVDVDFWSQVERSAPGAPRNFTVIFAGQFMLRKGVSYLLEAWRECQLRDAELWIAGPVFDDARHVLTPLPDNVKVLGNKTHAELRRLYRDCDVYILPSLEEGMARATLEAMATGLPVIVTEETGVGDIIRHGEDGWIIPAKSIDAISNVLREAAGNRSATAKKGDSARNRVQPYTWKAYGERAASFLRSIIEPA